jgi:catechol 2,3-dioxygenase-like lactoylglutathione lyase family enzyme
MPSEYYTIFAADLRASTHWYTDVLGAEPVATPDGPCYGLDTGATLQLTAQGKPAEYILPVRDVAGYRQRFEHRFTVGGDNQGRLTAAQPDSLTLVDPAGNQLRFVAGPSVGQPVC